MCGLVDAAMAALRKSFTTGEVNQVEHGILRAITQVLLGDLVIEDVRGTFALSLPILLFLFEFALQNCLLAHAQVRVVVDFVNALRHGVSLGQLGVDLCHRRELRLQLNRLHRTLAELALLVRQVLLVL